MIRVTYEFSECEDDEFLSLSQYEFHYAYQGEFFEVTLVLRKNQLVLSDCLYFE